MSTLSQPLFAGRLPENTIFGALLKSIRVRPPMVLIGRGERHRLERLKPLEVVVNCDYLQHPASF